MIKMTSIYFRLENLQEDTLYFALKSNYVQRIKISQRKHQNRKMTSNADKDFWTRVEKKSIEEIFNAYKLDFLLFGYSARERTSNSF